MNINAIILFTIGCLLFISCDKGNEMTSEVETSTMDNLVDSTCMVYIPIIPETSEFDLNGDSIADFMIKYFLTDYDGSNGVSSAYMGRLLPIGENQVLRESSAPLLFQLSLDDIKVNVEAPLEWDDANSHSLVTLVYCGDDKWSKNWSHYIMTEEYPSYLIGLKLLNDNLNVLGWIEIEISKSDGIISIIDKGIL